MVAVLIQRQRHRWARRRCQQSVQHLDHHNLCSLSIKTGNCRATLIHAWRRPPPRAPGRWIRPVCVSRVYSISRVRGDQPTRDSIGDYIFSCYFYTFNTSGRDAIYRRVNAVWSVTVSSRDSCICATVYLSIYIFRKVCPAIPRGLMRRFTALARVDTHARWCLYAAVASHSPCRP